MERLSAQGVDAAFDPACGLVRDLAVADAGRRIAPLHAAPWLAESRPAGLDPHLARLAGDFFCAPFGRHDGASGLHGWPANSDWLVLERPGPGRLRAALARAVRGAHLVKELALEDGHPFLYQRHIFIGGEGEVTVANHAMVALPRGGLLRASPKAFWMTPPAAPEPDPATGRSLLLYPARAEDPRAFPTAAGGHADLTRYPWGERHEDFVVACEAPGRAFGWTAVTRPEGDLFVSLRDARVTPLTMLWHSNGGRDLPPWSGRHRGCLGVEEGAAAEMIGAPLGPGQPRALALGGLAEVRHAIGAIAWPGDEAVAAIEPEGDGLVIAGEAGTRRRLPFRAGFLTAG